MATPLAASSFIDDAWHEIRLCKGDKLLVGCMYRSPGSTLENNVQLLEVMKAASSGGYSHVVIMGDFNYPDLDWNLACSTVGETQEASKFMEGVRDTFMHQHIMYPTLHRGKQQPNVLDLVFSNEADIVDSVEYGHPIGKSHHTVLTWRINCYCDLHTTKKHQKQYHKEDYTGFNEYLAR